MIKQIHHIGIAVRSLEEHIPFYRDILNLKMTERDEIPDQKVKIAAFEIGGVTIELLEPTSPESAIAKYIDKKGEGIHHVAYQTDGIEKEIAALKDKGITMIDQKPRTGMHETKIAFIHPVSSGKILSELTQVI